MFAIRKYLQLHAHKEKYIRKYLHLHAHKEKYIRES